MRRFELPAAIAANVESVRAFTALVDFRNEVTTTRGPTPGLAYA
jgi:hypothetical protein